MPLRAAATARQGPADWAARRSCPRCPEARWIPWKHRARLHGGGVRGAPYRAHPCATQQHRAVPRCAREPEQATDKPVCQTQAPASATHPAPGQDRAVQQDLTLAPGWCVPAARTAGSLRTVVTGFPATGKAVRWRLGSGDRVSSRVFGHTGGRVAQWVKGRAADVAGSPDSTAYFTCSASPRRKHKRSHADRLYYAAGVQLGSV